MFYILTLYCFVDLWNVKIKLKLKLKIIRGCQHALTNTQLNTVGRNACDPCHLFIHSFIFHSHSVTPQKVTYETMGHKSWSKITYVQITVVLDIRKRSNMSNKK